MTGSKRVDVFSFDSRLVVDPQSVPVRILVTTPQGPRHIELNALSGEESVGFIRRDELDRLLQHRLNTISEQAHTRALQVVSSNENLFDKVRVFTPPAPFELPTPPVKPEWVADPRDYVELELQQKGLEFVSLLDVHSGREDWRGNYCRPLPPIPGPPELPVDGTVGDWKSWGYRYKKWLGAASLREHAIDRWRFSNNLTVLRGDGTLAEPTARMVILRKSVETARELTGVPVALPTGDGAVDEFDPALLVPALVLSIQELQAQLQELKRELAELKSA